MAETDLIAIVSAIRIPVFIIQGMHDYQTTWEQAKAFYDHVQAPKKAFYTFELSAHTPYIEETERFHQIIETEILTKEKKSP